MISNICIYTYKYTVTCLFAITRNAEAKLFPSQFFQAAVPRNVLRGLGFLQIHISVTPRKALSSIILYGWVSYDVIILESGIAVTQFIHVAWPFTSMIIWAVLSVEQRSNSYQFPYKMTSKASQQGKWLAKKTVNLLWSPPSSRWRWKGAGLELHQTVAEEQWCLTP